jgi:hypothetical protein
MGFSVEDLDEAKQRLMGAGGKELQTLGSTSAHFEVKFGGPEGIVVDLGHWAGTAPLPEREPASAKA